MDSAKSRLRFVRGIVVVILSLLGVEALRRWSDQSMGRPEFLTGYTLLAVCIGMMLLSMRKRLLFLPLGRLAIWQQMHHYAGLFAAGSFLLHAGFEVNGVLETILAALFWSISLSGILGWYINYRTPKLLRNAGPAVLRDDIASLRRDLARQAYGLAVSAAGKLESATLSEHYLQKLRPFFQQRRSMAYCLVPNGRMRRRLLQELDQIVRYLGPEGRDSHASMSRLVREKDDLDFQWAMQNRLRGWVIVHISLIWSFYLVVAYHVYTVYRFHGS
jgi:hypothetical protein